MRVHSQFKLNGILFQDKESLLIQAKGLSNSLFNFFKAWLSDSSFVTVQTSGSTGRPKEILLSKKNMCNSALATGHYFNLFEGTTALLCMSTDYIAGKMMLVRAMVLGWSIDVILPKSSLVLTKKYNFAAMVPMQVQKSLSQIYKIKTLIVGGGVVSEQLMMQLQDLPTQIYATYGMTETITHIAVKKLNNCNEFDRTYYQLMPGIMAYIDQRNCLVIEAPLVSRQIVITNDVVSLISDKYFKWLGRLDNVINSGGVKLFPEKIEVVLCKWIPNRRFFVASKTDSLLGQKLVLIVEGSPVEIDLSKSNLSRYELPKSIYFVPVFNETDTGKVHRSNTLKKLHI